MKKALVLCGGIPQIELIRQLKDRGYFTILADMNEKVAGRRYADDFYPVSVLDVEAVEQLARIEQVDFVITVCADQVLQVVAEVSERLGLPCYIDYETAVKVSQKPYMKQIFTENGIPTSRYIITDVLDESSVCGLNFPLIVKPADSYSSRGVSKVDNMAALSDAFETARGISRTHHAIVEEFVAGDELTVDVYVSNGVAHILCISNLDKIPCADRFVICRTRCPAVIQPGISGKIAETVQKIADAFNIKNAPMLVQMIVSGENISVVEFCARTGGGEKFSLIKKVSGFDVVKAVIDLTLGLKPTVGSQIKPDLFVLTEFLYAEPGILDYIEGVDGLIDSGIVSEFHQLKQQGSNVGGASSSSDRVAYFSIEASSYEDILSRYKEAINVLRIMSADCKDITLRGHFINC